MCSGLEPLCDQISQKPEEEELNSHQNKQHGRFPQVVKGRDDLVQPVRQAYQEEENARRDENF